MRRSLVSACLSLSLLVPTVAPAPARAEPEKAAVGQYVDLSPVPLPVVVDGRIRNNVFVTVRLELNAKADPQKYREKEPYFRDALVRAGHRTPFVLATDWSRLDEAALKTAMLKEAAALVGPGVVTGVTILSATPQRRAAAPQTRR